MDIKQVWFAGAHCDIGGSYEPDKNGSFSSDIPLSWMIKEAGKFGLTIESHLKQSIDINPLATIHKSRRSFYRIKKKFNRSIDHGKGPILIHKSVKLRWDQDPNYRPQNLQDYVNKKGWGNVLVQ